MGLSFLEETKIYVTKKKSQAIPQRSPFPPNDLPFPMIPQDPQLISHHLQLSDQDRPFPYTMHFCDFDFLFCFVFDSKKKNKKKKKKKKKKKNKF